VALLWLPAVSTGTATGRLMSQLPGITCAASLCRNDCFNSKREAKSHAVDSNATAGLARTQDALLVRAGHGKQAHWPDADPV
jgi:hypothetical protein